MTGTGAVGRVKAPPSCPSCGGELAPAGDGMLRCIYCGNEYEPATAVSVADYVNGLPRRDNLGALLRAGEWRGYEVRQLKECGGLIDTFTTYGEFEDFFDDPAYTWWNIGRAKLLAMYVSDGPERMEVRVTPGCRLVFEGGLYAVRCFDADAVGRNTCGMSARGAAAAILTAEIENARDGVWSLDLYGCPRFTATLCDIVAVGKVSDGRRAA